MIFKYSVSHGVPLRNSFSLKKLMHTSHQVINKGIEGNRKLLSITSQFEKREGEGELSTSYSLSRKLRGTLVFNE